MSTPLAKKTASCHTHPELKQHSNNNSSSSSMKLIEIQVTNNH
jgi:hypothetical protein